MFKDHHCCHGLMLIELMIAFAVSVFLLLTLTIIYAATEKNQQVQIALNTIQENARAALQLLQENIAVAGNIGCARLRADFPLKNGVLSPASKIIGTEHSITVRGASVESAGLINMMPDDKTMYVTAAPRFKSGQTGLIANCQQAELFVVQSATQTQGRQKIVARQALSQRYGLDAEVSYFLSNTYFVDTTSRRDPSGKVIAALYARDLEGKKTEWVEGVSAMQVKFDVRQGNRLVTLAAGEVSDWQEVVAARITLTLNAVNGYPLSKQWVSYVAI